MALLTKEKSKPAEAKSRTLSDFPEWKQASDKLTELRGREQELDRRLSCNRGAIVQEQADTFEAHAKAYLETGILPDFDEREKNDRAQQQVQNELRIVRKARELQERRLQLVTAKFSRVVCEDLKPAHRARAAKIAQAIFALLALNEEELAFGEELQAQGVTRTASLPPLVFLMTGRLNDRQAMGVKWIEEALANGALDKTDPSARALRIAQDQQTERESDSRR